MGESREIKRGGKGEKNTKMATKKRGKKGEFTGVRKWSLPRSG